MAKKQEGTKREVTPVDLQGIPDTHTPARPKNAKVVKKKTQTPEERLKSRTTRVGRPLIFNSAEEMEDKIEEYFAYCDNRTVEIFVPALGEHVTMSKPAPYTMSGLALALGVDRQTLLNYGQKDEFFGTVQRARLRVEHNLEERMNDKETFTPGLIFNLKNNFGYVDKIENEHSMKELPKPIISLPQPDQEGSDDGQDD